MQRYVLFGFFFFAVFLQAGAYGLTFMLPELFADFGANEKAVGFMLLITAMATLVSVALSGHIADLFGRLPTLSGACGCIAVALVLYGQAGRLGVGITAASILLGVGWGLTYTLAPIVLTRIVIPEQRVRYFALLSVAVMAGFGLTPVLASVLERMGYAVSLTFYITGAICVLAAGLFLLITPHVRDHSIESGAEALSRLTTAAFVNVMRTPARLPIVMVLLGACVFAGMNNFQTVYADQRGLDYAQYFLIYTVTVVALRLLLAGFRGGPNPYRVIAWLQYVMTGSVVLFIFSGSSLVSYGLVALLFGVGYGVSYPILAAMAANDADDHVLSQTLQLFALSYFVGIFGFPLFAGWLLVDYGSLSVLLVSALLAMTEASLALKRAFRFN